MKHGVQKHVQLKDTIAMLLLVLLLLLLFYSQQFLFSTIWMEANKVKVNADRFLNEKGCIIKASTHTGILFAI